MIPSGRGWAHHSLTYPNGVDFHATDVKGRWNPLASTAAGTGGDGIAPSIGIASDPANTNRACLQMGAMDSTALGDMAFLRYEFQHTQVNANVQIDERPSELWFERELYIGVTGLTNFTGSATATWLRLEVELPNATGGFHFRNIGQNSASQFNRSGLTNAPTNAPGWTHRQGTGYATVDGSAVNADRDFATPWTTGVWRTLRFHYKAATTPGTTGASSLDGVLEIYMSTGSSGNSDALTFTLIKSYPHGGGRLMGIFPTVWHENANPVGAYTILYQNRNSCWGTTDPALGDGILTPNGGMTGATPWFTHCGGRGAPHLGAQTASGSTVTAKVHGFYDANQFDSIVTSATATVEWDTSSSFAAPTALGAVTFSAANRNCWSATATGLPQNSTVYFRVKYQADGGTIYTSSTSVLKTISATVPSIIRIVHGSCTDLSTALTPMSAFDRIPDETPNYVFHLGDLVYLDNANYMFSGAPIATALTNYVAAGADATARKLIIEQYNVRATYGSSQWEKAACRASSIVMRSDHDDIDQYAGASTVTPADFNTPAPAPTNGNLLRAEVDEVYRDLLGNATTNYDKNIAFSFTSATWVEGSKTLTQVGSFAGAVAGQSVRITGGANATTGVYICATATPPDSITLTTSIGALATVGITGDVGSTVNYQLLETARIAFFILDTRRHFNKDGATVLGLTQNTWLVDALGATTKPIVVLTADGPWYTTNDETADNFGGYTTPRNLVFDEIQANANIRAAYLLSADRHYMSIKTDESNNNFRTWPKIKGCFSSGSFNQLARDPAAFETGANAYQSNFGKSTVQCLRAYMVTTINEASESVNVEVVNGETGGVTFAVGFGGAAGMARLVHGILVDDEEE